ncbi:alpha/beta hydrolase [Thalassococcus lentus]|uniref:Alpha/beta hydrolase n=1 Tax=Thalassococcus lentus TaxID=1210524 RepID=A0ABT4XWC0_9RHOB|nr:alpha/beta hydrolase [Thalassococcus lentus]MDA7426263.1 alpha/beta hydrolase [Thalassococcus lentus]
MIRCFRTATLALTLIAGLLPATSQAQDISKLISLGVLAETDPNAALQETDAALRDPGVLGTPPDVRILLDLLELRAALLEQTGQLEDAAKVWAHVGRTRLFARADVRDDPVPAYEQAAILFEQIGSVTAARQTIEAAIAAEAETGRDGAAMQRLYASLQRLAELEGETEMADAARAALEELETPSFEFSGKSEDGGFAEVDVYYATDRARSGRQDPTEFYSGRRGKKLELGIATVTIPNTHVPGTVERPSVWRLDFRRNASRHVLLQKIEPLDDGSFFGRLQGEFREDAGRDMFVYIHGFNHDFEYAAQRAAQLAYDMGSAAVPVLFSWPSRNTTVGYIADAAVVRLSGRRLAVFLEDLVAKSGAETIHIIAHSMGNRALTDALEIMALERRVQPQDDPVFGQVMFAAPDVDAQLFAAMARVFRPLAKRMTLYASSKDWALVSSRKLHGSAPRAGLGGDVLLADNHFDSIDMSTLGEDMLAHNYFSNDSSALADMMTLFWRDAPPEHRCGLTPRVTTSGTVWEYLEGQCPTNDLIGVIANLKSQRLSAPDDIRAMVPTLVPQQARANLVMPVLDRILIGGQ